MPVSFANLLTENDIAQTVSSLEYAYELDAAARKLSQKVTVHIKLDTGMTRLGIYAHKGSVASAADDAEKIAKLPFLFAEGIFTHFAEAENDDISFSEEQFTAFEETVGILRQRGITFNFCHCANSSAVVNYKRSHLSCVRPGLLLYGISPKAEMTEDLDLRPVMTFRSIVADVRDIKKGDYISYSRTFRAERNMKIAVICCGYADGLSRALSGCGEFEIHGKRAKILGNVCMDLTVVDVSHIPEVKPFDPVVVFDGVLLAEHAKLANTITYELLTSVSKRVLRTYIHSPA